MNTKKYAKAWLEDRLGQRFDIPMSGGSPIVVGRGASFKAAGRPFVEIPQNELTMKVSREHAHLTWTAEGDVQIADAGSRFGVTVGGQKAAAGAPLTLTDGATVLLGNYDLTFHGEAAAAAAPGDTVLQAPTEAPTQLAAGGGDKHGNVEIDAQPVTLVMSPETMAKAMQDQGPPVFESGATMALPEFKPSAAPDFGGVAGKRYFLDVWIDGKVESLELQQAPQRRQWTVGRDRRHPVGPGDVDHVAVPNLPDFRSVSRKHLMLSVEEGLWRVKNLGKQGFWLNERHLAGEDETPVQPGDRLIMGASVFYFREGEAKREHQAADFDAAAIVKALKEGRPARAAEAARAAGVDPDATRELPAGFFHELTGVSEGKAWGYLVENTHLNPRRFALSKRAVRIGSHPLNCEIQMEDPGISDLHAIIRWHGQDIRVHSKNSEMPVRVNHVPFRTSSPLKDGTILTLGNREFRLQIAGEPPDVLSYQARQRLRRSLLFFVMALNLLFFGGYFGLRAITPDKEAVKVEPAPPWSEIVQSVVKTEGPAGLAALEKGLSEAMASVLEERELTQNLPDSGEDKAFKEKKLPELKALEDEIVSIQQTVIPKLKALAVAYDQVHRTTPDEFRKATPEIQQALADGRSVFTAAYGSQSDADTGWYKKLVDSYQDRKDSAFSSDWAHFLDALRNDNVAEAKNELTRLGQAGFRQERLDSANELLKQWKTIGDESRSPTPDDILLEYRRQCKVGKSQQYLADQGAVIKRRLARFDELLGGDDPAAKALSESARWQEYQGRAAMLRDLIELLNRYQSNDAAGFAQLYASVTSQVSNPALPILDKNLKAWQALEARVKSLPNPLTDNNLQRDLQQIGEEIRDTVDPNSGLYAAIQQRAGELSKGRVAQADKLRREAETQTAPHAQLMKLLEAVEYDAQEKAIDDLSRVAIRYFGSLNSAGQAKVQAEKANLCELLARMQQLSRKGVLPDSFTPRRQLMTLMSQFGVDCGG